MIHSLYIHIPFCHHRCAYCDFNTYAGQEDAIPTYVEAVTKEIEWVGEHAPSRVRLGTVFMGGGTPSLLTADQVCAIMEAIRNSFELEPKGEITMEANPGSVSYETLVEYRGAGVNRLSFGAQSANGEELRMLERTHTFLDVMGAMAAARRAGFDNLNLDLIYGLPEQSLEIWKTSVRRVLELHPNHISAYALTLEHGTPFGRWADRGLLPTPNPDGAADMYEWASDEFERAGFAQYEISNWARVGGQTGHECRHNLQYWRCLPYLGVGAGAHSYAGGYRYSNVLRIKTYIERMKEAGKKRSASFPLSPAAVNQHEQRTTDELSEFMITGLRLTREGVSEAEFEARFGRALGQAYGKEIRELCEQNLLEWVDKEPRRLRLTKRGRLLANRVFVRFV